MTTTTYYSLNIPVNFGSTNVWGTLLNGDLGQIDTAVWMASLGTVIGVNSQSSATSITLTNPLNNIQEISFSATSQKLILPAMNATFSLVKGGLLRVKNIGSDAFSVVAQDGTTTIVSNIAAGQGISLTLVDNSTANGSFLVGLPLDAANNLSDVANVNTSLNNLLPSQTSNSGKFLTTNGTSSSWGVPSQVITGSISIWSTNTAPSGYLECDGSAVSQTTYAALFAVLGTIWGPATGGNFTLPDFRGYFPRGWAHGGSIDSGRAFASTQADAYLNHSHSVIDPGHTHVVPVGSFTNSGSTITGASATSTGTATPSPNTSTTGVTVDTSTTGGTETRPINVAVMYIIKT